MTNTLNAIAEKWFTWELAMLWQAGLLIVIIAGLDLLIRKWVWPQVRYALWLLILVKLILPPTLTSPISFTAEIPFMARYAAVKISQPQVPQQVISPAIEPMPISVTRQPVEITPVISELSVAPTVVRLSPKVYVLFTWLVGVVILSGWLIIRLRGLRRQHLKNEPQLRLPQRLNDLLESTAQKLNLKRIPQVILTNKVCCPAVFGTFHPVLLMPADKLSSLTREDAENIFLHELAHIKRGDLFVHAVYMILQIAYWFNPLLWLIRKPLQNLRELCCDATVARLLREKTVSYRQTLLETARQLLAVPVDPGLGLLGLFENSSWLIDRLRWLEKKSWKYRPLRIATIFVMICLMATCVLPMTKYEAPVDFVIKGRVTDAQTGKPIEGAKVGDVEEYASGQYYTTTDVNGNYSYKTWYEEHNIRCEAEGYQVQNNILLTKVFGREKEKVIDFQLRENSQGVTIDLSAKKDEFDSGEIIQLHTKVTCQSDKELLITEGEYGFRLIVDGNEYLWNPIGRKVRPVHMRMKNGDVCTVLITIDKDEWRSVKDGRVFLEFKPGRHTIQVVAIPHPQSEFKGKIYSNTIEIKIKSDKTDVRVEAEKSTEQNANEADENSQKSAGQDEKASDTNNVSDSSAAQEDVKKAKALRITVYEGDNKEPQTSVYIPIAAMRIVRSLLPSKDKLQIIAQKIKLDEELPEGLDSETLIDMLEEMLKQVDAGIEATTLLEVKDGTERVIIELE